MQFQKTDYENMGLKILLPWTSMGIFAIPGLMFGAGTAEGWVAGISLGIKLGFFHGGLLSLILFNYPADEKWSILLPAIFMGVGTGGGSLIGAFSGVSVVGGAMGGMIGTLVACLFLLFIGTFTVWERTTQIWLGRFSPLAFALGILACALVGTLVIAAIAGIFSGWTVVGSLIALCLYIFYDILVFMEAVRNREKKGKKIPIPYNR